MITGTLGHRAAALLPLLIATASLAAADPRLDPVAKIGFADAAGRAAWGQSITMRDGLALIGAPREVVDGRMTGTVSVFDLQNRTELRRLAAPEAAEGDAFGRAIAFDDTHALVGAPLTDSVGLDAGTAHLFDLATGTWITSLLGIDTAETDRFGWAVSISGDRAIVGAPLHDFAEPETGAAYLFDTSTGDMIRLLFDISPTSNDQFGYAVALSGTHAVVGAPQAYDGPVRSGAAIIFDITTGRIVSRITGVNPGVGDYFGVAVAADAGHALIGAFSDDEAGPDAGAAYLYDLATGAFARKLFAPNAIAAANFGVSVALGDGRAIVGAAGDSGSDYLAGAAFVYEARTGTSIASLRSVDSLPLDEFGAAVATADGITLVGAPGHDAFNFEAGAAYLFAEPGAAPWLDLLPGSACPGTIALIVRGLTPDERVLLAFSTNPGPYRIGSGGSICPGIMIDLQPPYLPGSPRIAQADHRGEARFATTLPADLCGVLHLQAIDLATCITSNMLRVD